MLQDETSRGEYARLREAAIEVLDAAPEVGGSTARLDSALEALRAELGGDRPPRTEGQRVVLDPFEHALAMKRYVDKDAFPIPLPERATEMQQWLDNDRRLDQPRGDGSYGHVAITELRAMIAAEFLEELAARLTPGAAFGPGRNGEDLARVAIDLAKELLAQTFVGE